MAVFRSNVPHTFTAREASEYDEFLSRLPGPYFVLIDGSGRIVGCGGYARREGSGVVDLCWGMICRERQGKGLGRRLAELRIERARKDPRTTSIRLTTSQHTMGFYARLGFETTEVEIDGHGPGIDRCDMVLDLGAVPSPVRSGVAGA